MKKFILAALAAGATLTWITPAVAAEGCGRGYHRGPHGGCRPNGGRGPVLVAPGLVIGQFYRDRGYWDGRRYYQHRYRDRGRWRYR